MSTPSTDALKTEIDQGKLKIGNEVKASTDLPTDANQALYVDSNKKLAGTALTASKPIYVDSSTVPQAGNLPFALQLHAGVSDTSFSVADIKGSSTLAADDIMHQTLVAGSGVTTFTKTGFLRVTITDSGGNITDGAHYIQIGSLS